jgi:hypothetical protein
LYLTFLTEPNAPISSYSMLPNIVPSSGNKNSEGVLAPFAPPGQIGEAPANMAVPLVILGFGSIFVG